MNTILVSNHFEIPGFQVHQHVGIVHGLIVRSPTIGQSVIGGLKSIFGGNISNFKDMCEQGRSDAYQLMLEDAASKGANAIICMRYTSSEVGRGNQSHSTEILCYGTAVIIKANDR